MEIDGVGGIHILYCMDRYRASEREEGGFGLLPILCYRRGGSKSRYRTLIRRESLGSGKGDARMRMMVLAESG
jgi:hypothetical protein